MLELTARLPRIARMMAYPKMKDTTIHPIHRKASSAWSSEHTDSKMFRMRARFQPT